MVEHNSMHCNPIGIFHTHRSEKYMAPRQASLDKASDSFITLNSGHNYEQALHDLLGFERIWLIYWLHLNKDWKPKVMTPRGGDKRGVFATRSPHRPNPIGLSCVQLLDIQGTKLFIGKNDLLDGTPILDIKPYINYADAFPNSREGWTINEAPISSYVVDWETEVQMQAQFIEGKTGINFIKSVELILSQNPFPFPNHRIKHIEDVDYELAFKTWRLRYTVMNHHVVIHQIASGYDLATLQGQKTSRWDDVPIHVEFNSLFKST